MARAIPFLTYMSSGFQFTDTAASVLSGSAQPGGRGARGQLLDPLQGMLKANDNYTIAFTGNTHYHHPGHPGHHGQPAEQDLWPEDDPALTYMSSGFQFADTGRLCPDRLRSPAPLVETVAGGSYAINQGTLAADNDYTIALYWKHPGHLPGHPVYQCQPADQGLWPERSRADLHVQRVPVHRAHGLARSCPALASVALRVETVAGGSYAIATREVWRPMTTILHCLHRQCPDHYPGHTHGDAQRAVLDNLQRGRAAGTWPILDNTGNYAINGF